ncbi:titin-like [Eriocheir sinensis]|uniref:titin-like n=1 Tax=Eriocheir sinensis TaxID=95602 RepID=UPI0021C8D200|nr:titin-like [Eriocheir sinensis]
MPGLCSGGHSVFNPRAVFCHTTASLLNFINFHSIIMNVFVVGTILILLGLGPIAESTGGVGGLPGLPDNNPRCAALVEAAKAEYRKLYAAGLKDAPNLMDLILTSLGIASNNTFKTIERKVFNNTDEMGHETGKKTVVEKTTETDVAPNGTVSKTSETTVDIDEDGKQSGEKSVTEKETMTGHTPNNGTIAQTVDVRKVMDEAGNEIKEEVVIKKELIVQPPTNTTDANLIVPKVGADDKGNNKTELKLGGSGKSDGLLNVERTEEIKEIMPGNMTNEVLVKQKEEQLSPQESTIVTSVERKNVTEKDDGLLNVERTEEIKEILPGNITNEVLVKQKEEQLSPQESTIVTSVERKNVTEKGDGKDVEKETVIQKEVEKNVCDSDIKEVRNEKHLNETIEDLKHQVDDVKNKIKEEKAKAEETNATRSLFEPSAAPIIQEGKVVEKIVPAVTPAKVVEKIPPTVTEGKVPVVKEEKVVEQAAPSATEEIVSVSKEQEEVPVVAEEKKVIEKIHPAMTEGKVPVVPQQEVVEKVAPSPTEEKVHVVTQERAIEQNAPQERVIEQAVPQERAIEQVAPQERVIEQAVPQERVIEQVTPQERVTEEVAPQERAIEQAVPQERVIEQNAPQERAIEQDQCHVSPSLLDIPKGECHQQE